MADQLARVLLPTAELRAGDVSLATAHRHLTRALRCRPGDEVVLFDGKGRVAHARITSITGADVRAVADSVETVPPPKGPAITSILPLIKGERMDWCIQKLGELGVRTIIPVSTERTVVKLKDARSAARVERWQSIALSAAIQSRQAYVAEVRPIAPLLSTVEEIRADAMWVFDAKASQSPEPGVNPGLAPSTAALLTGPEGGLSPRELEAAVSCGYVQAHLGQRILRAETAAMVAATVVSFVYGDMGGTIALAKAGAV